MIQNLETQRKRYETIAKVGALLVLGFFVAPFIFISIKGLVGLLIAGTVSMVVINFIPYFAAKLANWKLKALKHEAAQNPIETLENDYNTRAQKLRDLGNSIKDFYAQIGIFKDKLVEFKKTYPNEADKFDMQLSQMEALLELRKNKYKDVKHNLELYECEIRKASAIWDMAKAAAEMSQAAGVDEDEFFAKIQVETALDSVQVSMNTAFAELELSLLDEDKDAKKVPAAKNVTPTPVAIEAPRNNSLELDLEVKSVKVKV